MTQTLLLKYAPTFSKGESKVWPIKKPSRVGYLESPAALLLSLTEFYRRLGGRIHVPRAFLEERLHPSPTL
jgi:hypothetical protein